MASALKRRWFQFSLRTLFVVLTVVSAGAIWLGQEIQWLRERQAWRNDDHANTVRGWYGGSLRKVPWLSQQLGEGPMLWWELLDSAWTEEDRVALQRLFPEAEVRLVDHFSYSEE
jgi:hypothetical protein